MNDRFKFRAWHKPSKKMFEVHCFTAEEVFENTLDGVGTSPTNPANMNDCVLMQSTGLKDKNGRLTYEGDIVFHRDKNVEIGKVEWEKGGFFVICNKWVIPWNFFTPSRWEVVGNIHENPELLEDK